MVMVGTRVRVGDIECERVGDTGGSGRSVDIVLECCTAPIRLGRGGGSFWESDCRLSSAIFACGGTLEGRGTWQVSWVRDALQPAHSFIGGS